MIVINVYDFDNTLYDGESSLDFYLFCVKRHPGLIKYFFIIVKSLLKYKMCLVDINELKRLADKYAGSFIRECPDVEQKVLDFWKTHIKKIKPFYNDTKRQDDIVVSASFSFLLMPVMESLGVKRVVCSQMSLESGEIYKLCYRQNKIKLFKELYDENEVDDFYTDSMNDLPFMKIAKGNVYMVKGGKIRLLPKERIQNYEK